MFLTLCMARRHQVGLGGGEFAIGRLLKILKNFGGFEITRLQQVVLGGRESLCGGLGVAVYCILIFSKLL